MKREIEIKQRYNAPWKLAVGILMALVILSTLSTAILTACTGPAETSISEVAEPALTYRDSPPIWSTQQEIETALSTQLSSANDSINRLLVVKGERTLENTLVPFNNALIQFDRVYYPAYELFQLHPDPAVRETADACYQQAQQYISGLYRNPELYAALAALEGNIDNAQAARFLELNLLDFRLSGVDKDKATRDKLQNLNDRITGLVQYFNRNLNSDVRYIELVSVDDMAGLPADFIASHPPEENGKIRITTQTTDYFPFISYADREDLRQALYREYSQVAYPANETVLKEIIQLRDEYAGLLGYESWAAYQAVDKMVGNTEVIYDFLERTAELARPQAEIDIQALLARKQQDTPAADAVWPWDSYYYSEKILTEKYAVDSQELRQYFEIEQTKDGLLGIVADLFGLEFRLVTDADVWDSSVEVYNIYEGQKAIGRFYLDLYPREGKSAWFSSGPLQTGVTGVQLPAAILIGNFPDPRSSDEPVLMEYGDVSTFLHEMGHVMHFIFSGDHRWIDLSGWACEWDFVEVPSTLLQAWASDVNVLQRFAKHYQSGEPIPAELVAKINKSGKFNRGSWVMVQTFYSIVFLRYYDQNAEDLNLLETWKEYMGKYNPYPYVETIHPYTSIGHVVDYTSNYYTYLWSQAIVTDIYARFKENGLMDRATAQAYREAILNPGGAVKAEDMVSNFLGRDYSFDAFEQWITAK